MNSDIRNLIVYGWNDYFEKLFQQYSLDDVCPGRVVLEHKETYRLQTQYGELLADISGRVRYEALSREDLPAVGDWVVARPRMAEGKATIHAVLPRKSKFTRKITGGRTEEQIVGANIDTIFLVTSLNNDFNLRRLERYLAVSWESGARPVILLSKADLCEEIEKRLAEVESIAKGVPVHAVSVFNNEGLDPLGQYFGEGQTIALLGSSGVGKSTLINRLTGQEVQRIQEIRQKRDRGRHTTTHRELILLPQGGLVLDTPGMRELQLWQADEGVKQTFDDIESLIGQCRFRDCRHQNEPGCAILRALEEGTIVHARYQNYEKLQKELRHLALRQDYHAQRVEKEKWKKLSRMAKEKSQIKRRGGE